MTYEELEKVNKEVTPMVMEHRDKKTGEVKKKAYVEVNQRVQAFRKLCPEGTIETEMLSNNGGMCIFKATVKNGDVVLATGFAYEKESANYINQTSYIENCETSAIGRALGFVGIGIENSIASYEEVNNAIRQQEYISTPLSKKDLTILVNTWTSAGGTEENLLSFCKVKKAEDITSAMRDKVLMKLKEKEDGK